MANYKLLSALVYSLLVVIALPFGISLTENEEKEESKAFCVVIKPKLSWRSKTVWPDADLALGKALFKMECAMCHHKNMKDDLTGPALGHTLKTWNNQIDSIKAYLHNPQQFLATTQMSHVKEVHERFGRMVHPAYEDLTDEEFQAILAYTQKIFY